MGRLTTIMFFRAEAEIFDGRYDDAAATAAEALRIAADTGQRQWVSQLSSALAHIAAVRGDEEECRRLVDAALAGGSGTAMAPGAPWAYWSQGLLDLGLGRAQAALERLALLGEESVRHHICATRSVPDLVEAAVRLGVPGARGRVLRPVRGVGGAVRAGLGGGAGGTAAGRCGRRTRTRRRTSGRRWRPTTRTGAPWSRHVPTLLYGEWLRRARRKNEARVRLRAALDDLRAARRAPVGRTGRGRELGAAGGAVPEAGQESGRWTRTAGLTPQESQIVRLAAEGLSNKDIAARLFLSPRTVGYHLYKAYPKLGVVSRGELAGLFG